MRRTAVPGLVCALVGALLLLAPSAAAGAGLEVIEASAKFPERAFVVTLPQQASLSAGNVEVRENGTRVPSISFVPAGEADAGELAVILVIDASDSMRGRAIRDAMGAGRAFASRRTPNQLLGVVTFNNAAKVVLAPTSDDGEISRALESTPRLAVGTRIYDGVAAALDLLDAAKVSSGSIIVLSDGADTGSRVSSQTVIDAARESHVRVFSVGIRSRQFSPGPLKKLATGAGGRYSLAGSSGELARIYSQLGAQLASEYLLRYRSTAGPREKVHVAIRVRGVPGVAVTGYSTPGRAAFELQAPFHRTLSYHFWRSPLTLLFVIFMTAFLIAFCVVAVVRPRSRTLRKRMAEFVSVSPAEQRGSAGRMTSRVFVGAERSLEATRWWGRFKESLELAQIRMPAIHILLWTIVGTLAAMWLLATILGSSLFAVFGLAVPFGVRGWIRRKLERRRRAFAEQLPDNLQVLASALRAGHSFVGALSVVVDDASEPSRSEFRRVVGDEQLGVPLDEALKTVVRRMENDDLDQVALVAALQRRAGGNMAEVLDRVTDTIRERFELRRMVATLTAQGRLSRWVVTALPVILLAAITALNPSYVEPLFSTTGGRVMLIGATVMVVSGSLVIKRIVDIKL
jgi:tight adherence protein B